MSPGPTAALPYSGRRLAEAEGFALSEMWGFGGERQWNEVSTALEPLLDHPDDGGEDLSPAEGMSILVRLDAITDEWAREDGHQLLQQRIEDTRQLMGVLRFCIEKDVPSDFSSEPHRPPNHLRDSP